MKHMKDVHISASIRRVEDYVECDMCHEKIARPDAYDVDDIVIKRDQGSSYPDGRFTEECSVDACGECWDTKIIPWLASVGVKPTRRDSGW